VNQKFFRNFSHGEAALPDGLDLRTVLDNPTGLSVAKSPFRIIDSAALPSGPQEGATALPGNQRYKQKK